jgi:hypothetical protein
VGEKSVNLHLAELTMKLAGRPYALNEAGGLDCFSSVAAYLSMRGVEIPEEFEGYSVLDYKDLFLSDPDTAKGLMVELIANLLDEINPHFAMAGDVLLAKPKEAESSKGQAESENGFPLNSPPTSDLPVGDVVGPPTSDLPVGDVVGPPTSDLPVGDVVGPPTSDLPVGDVVGPLSALRSTLRALSSPLYASLFLAIHGGNGSMLGATIERGLVPLPIRAFDVLRAFRVREGGT